MVARDGNRADYCTVTACHTVASPARQEGRHRMLLTAAQQGPDGSWPSPPQPLSPCTKGQTAGMDRYGSPAVSNCFDYAFSFCKQHIYSVLGFDFCSDLVFYD